MIRPTGSIGLRLVPQLKWTLDSLSGRAAHAAVQKGPTKVPVYIRLDADIVEHFRDGGKGWQTRLNDTLREAVIET